MTMTKIQAETAGKALLKKLRGKGWRLRVWENLGWYYEVRNDHIMVSPGYLNNSYYAMISDDRNGSGGLSAWTCRGGAGHFTDPNKAVVFATKQARAHVDHLLSAVGYCESIVGEGIALQRLSSKLRRIQKQRRGGIIRKKKAVMNTPEEIFSEMSSEDLIQVAHDMSLVVIPSDSKLRRVADRIFGVRSYHKASKEELMFLGPSLAKVMANRLRGSNRHQPNWLGQN